MRERMAWGEVGAEGGGMVQVPVCMCVHVCAQGRYSPVNNINRGSQRGLLTSVSFYVSHPLELEGVVQSTNPGSKESKPLKLIKICALSSGIHKWEV